MDVPTSSLRASSLIRAGVEAVTAAKPNPLIIASKRRIQKLVTKGIARRGRPPTMTYFEDQYPITWEAHASQANYEGMALISQEYVDRRICAPHAWHAAEMFLYFLDEQQILSNRQGSII